MKLIHLSDLHLGKRVHECPMREDQEYILTDILRQIREEAPDGVLIAGDVYDKSVPPAEAVRMFDNFLVTLSAAVPAIFVISGNHDSAERLAFGGRLMGRSGVYVAPVYDGTISPIPLRDEYGEVDVYLLPFLKPAQIRPFFPDAIIDSYTDAMRAALSVCPKRQGVRRVLVTHQFVIGASRCDSEEVSVGGSDGMDASVFDEFDYVALGHLHGAQSVERETVRYCGTPLKYSFSEAKQEKSITVVELGAPGNVTVRTRPLPPLHDMRELRGSYMELTARGNYLGTAVDDYLHITLTDEEDIPDAIGKLRTIYPNLLRLDYDNARTRSHAVLDGASVEQKTPLELFEELYEAQNGQPMSTEQATFMTDLMERIWGCDA